MEIFQKYWFVLVAIIVLLVALIIILLIYIKNTVTNNSSNYIERKKMIPYDEGDKDIFEKAKGSIYNSFGDKEQTDEIKAAEFIKSDASYSGDTMLLFDAPKKIWINDTDNKEMRFELPLTDEGVCIGRGASNQVCLDYGDMISDVHCRIYPVEGKTYIRNMSKTGSIEVNGKIVEDCIAIYSGSEVSIGNIRLCVRFA